MAIRRSKPFTFRARGLSDAIDGTNAFPGAMASLQNLVPFPGCEGVWVPRPAAVGIAGGAGAEVKWGSFNWGSANWGGFGAVDGAAQINGLLAVGPWIYGMAASTAGANAGMDVPFAFNFLTQVFANISIPRGPTSLPNTPAGLGDWTPPTMQQVGNRIMISHPGYPGGNGSYFGWLDLSGFSDDSKTGSTHTSALVDTLSANVLLAGWQVGMTIADTNGNIPPGTTIKAIAADGLSLTLSQSATGSSAGDALQVAGGTLAAPLYDSGNTNGNPLAAVPVSICQFNARAYFAVGTALVFSDAGSPCQVTNASQALAAQNGLTFSALAGLPLSQYVGGVLQSLIAFQGDANMVQVTGDAATSNLAQNNLGIGVGTNAPNTICSTPLGVAFVAPDGLRIITFSGQVTEPIGRRGQGVIQPFINSVFPSRMCAAYNQDVLRISTLNGSLPNQPAQEFWYHFSDKVWSGPHTFPAALIEPLQAPPGALSGHGFVMAAWNINATLYSSTVTPTAESSFVENNQPMQWVWAPCLWAADGSMSRSAIIESIIAMALPPQQLAQISVSDEENNLLGTVILQGEGEAGQIWGGFNWGAATWGASYPFYRQRRLPWDQPLIFTQSFIQATGISAANLAIGNLYVRYQELGYAPVAFPILQPAPPAPNVIVTEGGVPIDTEAGQPIATEG